MTRWEIIKEIIAAAAFAVAMIGIIIIGLAA